MPKWRKNLDDTSEKRIEAVKVAIAKNTIKNDEI